MNENAWISNFQNPLGRCYITI